jgi:hypothetical protein
MQTAYGISFISLSEIWLAVSQITGNFQPLSKFLWIFPAMNLSKLHEKCGK